MTTLPTIVDASGLVPIAPADLRASLVALVAATNPGYTANLPGTLIEDIASTDVGALVVCDQARVDLVNSLTPYAANLFLLNQLGAIYGVTQGQSSNTSVLAVFGGPPGFVVAQGFTISDGTNQFVAQDGTIITDTGFSDPVFCLSSLPGIFVVPANTVTDLITSVPNDAGGTPIALTVNNPQDGTPGSDPESEGAYRAACLQAGIAVSQGMTTMLRTALRRVPGVQTRLVSVRQQTAGGWSVLVGGGDPNDVAYAIFMGLFDISSLVGSSIDSGRDITVSIDDSPDTYTVVYINPPQQIVGIALTWNTTLTNFLSAASVAQFGAPALVDYVNSLNAGQALNIFLMQEAFTTAISAIIPAQLLDRMVFAITIDGTVTNPISGTEIIPGDPEGYFFTDTTHIAIVRG